MIRRTFLKKGLAAASAGILGAPLAAKAVDLNRWAPPQYSLYVVTDLPDEAVAAVEDWFTGFAGGIVRFQSGILPGRHVGDIALFQNGRLQDYRIRSDVDTSGLRHLASLHELPRPIDDPTLLQFRLGAGSGAPTRAEVFREGLIVGALPLSQDVEGHRIESAHGHVTVSVTNRRVRIIEASCRHKTCMEMGEIGSAGQSLACIPARISITLDGAAATDATTL